jgi:ATP-binding cassette subfamily B protein
VALSLGAFLGARLLEASVPLFLREGIDALDAALAAGGAVTDVDLRGPALGIVAAVLARLFVVSGARIAIRRASINVAYDLRQALFDRLQRQGVSFFGRHSVGDMMTRAVSDVSLIRRLISTGTILIVIMVYATLVGFAAMFWLAPELAWLVLPPLPVVAFYAIRGSRRMNQASRVVQDRTSALTDRTQEAFGGIRTLQVMAREELELGRFDADNDAYAEAFRRQARISSLMTAVMPTLAAGASLLVIGWGGHLVLTGAISKGTFVAFFSYVAMVIQPMRMTGWLLNLLQRAAVGCERVFEILDAPDEFPDAPSGRTPARPRGRLELRGFRYRYPAAERPALESVDLTVEAGTSLAVMGRIGAGKSTLLAAFARLVEAAPGEVRLDGHDVADWPLSQLRREVVLVPQDALLFGQPLRDNLSYDDPTRPEASVLQAAARAELTALLERLPEGLATLVGERGVTLSGGQRQRATVARGVIRDAPVLLLDDCFAAVDTETEERILAHLIEARAARTTVMVTHRVSTARHADRILVLENGRATEYGDHAALLAAGGWYATLAREQESATALPGALELPA